MAVSTVYNIFTILTALKLKKKKKSPANSEIALFEQYVHDLDAVLDRHVSLVSRLTKILQIC